MNQKSVTRMGISVLVRLNIIIVFLLPTPPAFAEDVGRSISAVTSSPLGDLIRPNASIEPPEVDLLSARNNSASAPAQQGSPEITIPVLVLVYGEEQAEVDILGQTLALMDLLAEGTSGYIRWELYDDGTDPDKIYRVDQAKWPDTPKKNGRGDYYAIYHDNGIADVCLLALEGKIKEVWIWAGNTGKLAESVANGPLFRLDSDRAPNCSVQIAAFTANYDDRVDDPDYQLANMFEPHIHHFEYFFQEYTNAVFPSGPPGTREMFRHRSLAQEFFSDQNPDKSWWDDCDPLRGDQWCYEDVEFLSDEASPYGFTDAALYNNVSEGDVTGQAQCGWAHYPPNVTYRARKALFPNDEYIYNYEEAVWSSCGSWDPDNPTFVLIDRTAWGCQSGEPADRGTCKYGFFRWWMRGIPSDWWEIIYDYETPNPDTDEIPTWFEVGCQPIEGGGYDCSNVDWANLPDADGNGVADYRELDSDHDGIWDSVEAYCTPGIGNPTFPPIPCDTDGDRLPDYRDKDSDNDNILDSYEVVCTPGVGDDNIPCNSDDAVIPDYRDIDSDDDGAPDLIEAGDQDPQTAPVEGDINNGIPAFRDPDDVYITPPSKTRAIEACRQLDPPLGFERGVECGLVLIRDTLNSAGIAITEDDPPVPSMLLAVTSPPLLTSGAIAQVSTNATHGDAPLSASLAASHAILYGGIKAVWTTDAWTSAQFTTLSIPRAQLYDEQDTLIATGLIQARSANGRSAVALALGDTLTYTIVGTGTTSFYAPALSGLGVGGNWLTYTAQISSETLYGVGLQGAIVSVDGQEYTGTLVLVTTDTLALQGQGHTLTPNFSDRATVQVSDSAVHIGSASLLAGSLPYGVADGFALSGYTGTLTITEHTPDLNLVELEGTFARDLALTLNPPTSSITPLEVSVFQPEIHSNQDDTYTVTVVPPLGWQAQIDFSGQITITPPLDAQPGDYSVRVSAQSVNSASLLFSTAVHTVSIASCSGMQLAVAPDPLTTVPWGAILPDSSTATVNNGQAQVPGAAYIATITNTSSVSHTFTVQVAPDNFSSDWIMLGGAGRSHTTTLTLPAGGVGRLGIYVSPASLETLPLAGTEYSFSVQATVTDDPALSESVPAIFTMPAVSFNYLQANPLLVYASPNIPTSFDVCLTNVGNVSDTFEVILATPAITWMAHAPYSVTLDIGAADERAVVFSPVGAALGDEEIIRIQSPAPGSPYVQTKYVGVRVVGPCAFEVSQATRVAELLSDTQLAAALENLTFQLSRWERDPDNQAPRQRTVAALNEVINRMWRADYPLVDIGGLESLVAAPTIAGFCDPMADLADQLAGIAARDVALDVTPGVQATLPGIPVSHIIRLSARGNLTTTYDLAVNDLPLDVPYVMRNISFTLTPGESVTTSLVVTPAKSGVYPFTVAATAQQDPLVERRQSAALRVVDAWFQIIAAQADPAYVEMGDNTTNLSAAIANTANLYWPAPADVQILAPDGTPMHTRTVPITLTPSLVWEYYDLGSLNVSGWPTGVYTISVRLPTPTGETWGEGLLGVGQAVHASHAISPTLVPPGTMTPTIIITTELGNGEIGTLVDWDTQLTNLPIYQSPNLPIPNTPSRPPGLAAPLYQIEPETTLVNTLIDAGTGQPVANASGSLRVYQPSGYGIIEWQDFATDGNGVFTLTFDTAISQTVRLHYYDLDGYADQYYERKRDLAEADLVTLQHGDNALTTRLDPTTRLANTLLDDRTGLPVANTSGSLRVYQASGYGIIESVSFETDSAGVYTATFDTLISQTVRLHYYDLDGYADQYYERKRELGDADPLPLQSGDNTLTTRLSPATRLVNTLLDDDTGRPVANESGSLRVYQPSGYGTLETVSFETDSAGVYTATFDTLISQTVRLHYYDVGGHLDQYYDRKLALAEADPLPLQSGGNALTTYLLPGTRLVNTLLDARTGRPISYTWGTVTVYEETGAGVIDSRDFGTDAAGVYTATFGLAISQTVRLGYQVDGYPPQYHQLRFSLEEADPVPFQDDTNSLVTPLSAYVPRLSPDTATAFSPPGRPVVHRLSLQNGGSLSDTFSLTLAGQACPEPVEGAWPVAAPTTVGPLAPGTSVDLEVVVTVPPTAAVGDSDAVTLTVASTGDPNLTDTSVLTTTAANALLQMCIALDGSGSIGGDEFSLMKDGLANAIRDESVTPQNGSVEISIVQYGADLAQVEVHPTVILGAAAAEEVAGQIEAIEQIGQSTPTDLGIDLCTVLMTNSGQFATAGTQVIDLPTDGAPNDKPAAVTARENAVAAGVDEVNAEAIDASTYAIDFLRDQLVYPQPGYDAPPFIPGRGGFVIQVSDFGQFAEAMRQKLQFVVDTSTYLVRVEHSLPVTGVIPLTGTAAPLPLYTLAGDEESQVVWQYVLAPDQPLATATFQARLPQMEPGEVRQVANGTLVRYTGTGGAGEVRLGPLYVTAAHLVAIAPLNQSVGVGGLGHYEVTLFNPTGVGQTYDLSVVGLPAGLAFNLPPTATLDAGQVLTVPLTVAAGVDASFDALPATFDFGVVAATAYGGSDAAQATLSVTPPTFALAISPDWQAAGNGESVTYTLTLTNLDAVAHTYALDVAGLDGNQVSLSLDVQVGAGESLSLPLAVTVHAPRGLYPFDVSATLDASLTTLYASAALAVSSERNVAARLTPSIIQAGQDSPAAFSLTVTNTGSLADTYTLTLSLPDGWSGGFRAPDSNLPSPISNLHLTPYVFNAANQQLIVTPAGGTPQGTYSITATIASASDPNASAQAVGYVQVSNYGVTVEIDPATTTMDPRGSQTWDVTVTNTGSEPDTFHLTAGGVISLSLSEEGDGTAQFSVNPVSLAAGASTVVQLTAHDLDFALAQTYPFVVEARSQADPDVAGYDTAEVTFLGFEQVAVTVAPITVTLTDTTTAQYLVFITNAGNLDTDYALSASAAPPGPDLALEMDDIYVPAHLVAGLLLTAQGHQPGTFTFTVQATSTTGLAAGAGSATLVIQESVFAHQPEAADDVVATFEDTPVAVDVLANDSDPDGDPLTVISMTQPFSGTAVIGPDDTVIYTPTANWYGTDAFSYTIGDGHGGTDDATVTVSVAPVNDPPLAVDDSATTAKDTPVTVDVLANDSDVDGDSLTVISTTQPLSGTATVNLDNTVTYTPTTDFYGTDSFTYTANDGHGGTDDATVTVNVIPINDPPAAMDDDAGTAEDTPVTVNVLANDYDPDEDPLAVISITQPLSGTAAVSPDDTVTYTPTTNWYGTDAFSYTIGDGNGGTDSATVTVDVTPVNDPPVAVDDDAATLEDAPVAVNVLANDYDVDGDPLMVISLTQPFNGLVAVGPYSTLTYTPTTNWYGTDSFSYTVGDDNGGAGTAMVTVSVTPVNDPPAAVGDWITTTEDSAVAVEVLANDYDVDGDPLTVVSITQPLSGVAAINLDDTVTYTPTNDFYGTDSFTYAISDGQGGTDSAAVTVTVAPVNDAPVAVDDEALTAEDTPVTMDVLANDSDVDGDPLTVISATRPLSGVVAVNLDGTVTYTPTTDWHGVDAFAYNISDGHGGVDSATVTVTVSPVNDPPVAADDYVTTTGGLSVTVDALANDYDVDGDVLTVISVTRPLSGTAGVNPDRTITYTPTAGLYGTDSFTYTISDGQGGLDVAIVRVVVITGTDCELYPIALHVDTLAGVEVGEEMEDIYNGDGPGNFGWLSWTGDQGVPTLAHSLTPPGDSDTYVNPDDPEDHHLSVDDWVRGRPGVGNAKTVRNALDALMPLTITLPVWDVADGQGANLRYHVVGFARVQITDYRLPGQNRVSAIFWGMTTCPEPGASAMSIGREVCEGNFWTCDLLMCRNVIGQNMSRFNGKEWPMR